MLFQFPKHNNKKRKVVSKLRVLNKCVAVLAFLPLVLIFNVFLTSVE